ncbi:hypothetical protein TNCV_1004211 [Trichonephila clavipes]|nr:hypothetical protein TNCV_1004211 [Trichonephila clavipes]
MTVSRIWNRWVQDGNTERRDGSQRTPITSSRENRHLSTWPYTESCSHVPSTESRMGSFARQQVSTRTVR